jgi:hypothetical protein
MTGPVGPRGLTVLVIVGIAGILLALIGWSQRGTEPASPARTAGIGVVISASVAGSEFAR